MYMCTFPPFQNTFHKTSVYSHNDLPSDLASYELSPQLLGKGCNASIYAARVTSIEPSRTDQHKDLEAVPMETKDGASGSLSDESEEDFVFLNADDDGVKSDETELPHKPEEHFDLAIKVLIFITSRCF